jgi:S-adenosyl methyltransferase
MLGGKNNFAADRAAAQQMLAAAPSAPLTARENRAFLGRAVRFLAEEAGIRQFLDIGTGLPTQSQVHEIAHSVAPDAQVVYVDFDPVVVVHGTALLSDTDKATIIQADLREPAKILVHPDVRNRLDFDTPTAVLFVAILHFVTDATVAADLLRQFRDVMTSGSYVVISHTSTRTAPAALAAAQKGFRRAGSPIVARSDDEILRLFEGFEVVEPGIVDVRQWHPESAEDASGEARQWVMVGGVGRKP